MGQHFMNQAKFHPTFPILLLLTSLERSKLTKLKYTFEGRIFHFASFENLKNLIQYFFCIFCIKNDQNSYNYHNINAQTFVLLFAIWKFANFIWQLCL